MKIIYWLGAQLVYVWWWIRTKACSRCETQTKRSQLYARPFDFFSGEKICGKCWQEERAEDHAATESALLEQEVQKQKRILLAREEAARRLEAEKQPYRE